MEFLHPKEEVARYENLALPSLQRSTFWEYAQVVDVKPVCGAGADVRLNRVLQRTRRNRRRRQRR